MSILYNSINYLYLVSCIIYNKTLYKIINNQKINKKLSDFDKNLNLINIDQILDKDSYFYKMNLDYIYNNDNEKKIYEIFKKIFFIDFDEKSFQEMYRSEDDYVDYYGRRINIQYLNSLHANNFQNIIKNIYIKKLYINNLLIAMNIMIIKFLFLFLFIYQLLIFI
jgi:hypothetical protein